MKRFLILFLFLLVPLAHAERVVEYNVYEAIVHEDGGVTYTSQPAPNVDAYGFVCADGNCDTYNQQLPGSTSENNEILVTYPTTSQSDHGYAHILDSPGYIPWEQRADFWGTEPSDPAGPYTTYVGKMEVCRSPIDSFAVINDATPNEPVQFEINTSLDATVWSAIEATGPVGFNAPQIPQSYEVETEVVLEIWGPEGNLLDTQSRIMNLPFSGAERVMFSWLPDRVGRYTATATTYVPDEKCLADDPAEVNKEFSVIGETTSQCYALANNLNVQPLHQHPGEGVTIGVETIANYYDPVGELHAMDSRLTITVENEQGLQDEMQFDIPAGSEEQYETTILPYSFQEAGLHVVEADVRPLNCPYSDSLFDTIDVEYLVEEGDVEENTEPTLNAQNVFLHEDDGVVQDIYNLEDFAWDPEQPANTLSFAIEDQTDTSVVSCSIDAQNNLDCTVFTGGTSVLDITVEDDQGAKGRDLVVVSVQETFQCNNGLDDDGDGKVDMDDAGCINPFDDDESDDPAIPECRDGIDNDNDGLIDLDDPGCADEDDTNEADGTTLCQDGVDNDNDGFIDLDDVGCDDVFDNDESNFFDLFIEDMRIVGTPMDGDEVFVSITPGIIPDEPLPVHVELLLVGSQQPVDVIVFDNDERVISLGNLPEGDYFLEFFVDPDDQFSEAVENNNYELLFFEVGASGGNDMVDLFVDNGRVVNPPATHNEETIIAFTTYAVPSGVEVVDIEARIDGVLLPQDMLVFNNVQEEEFSVGTLAEGTHELEIWVDTNDDVQESNENNNYFSFTFEVIEGDNGNLAFTNQPSTVGYVDVTYDFDLDVNQDGATFSLLQGPAGMAVDSSTGRVLWRPESTGTHTIIVQATNDGQTATKTWTITVFETTSPQPTPSSIEREDITLTSIRFTESEFLRAGEPVEIQVYMENGGNVNFDRSRVTISIPALGVHRSAGPFDLDTGDDFAKTVSLTIPYDALPGEYLVRISAGNPERRRVTHRYVTIE